MINSERLSRETASTSMGRVSSASLSMPITDLERRLATDKTLDIFTMKPKVFIVLDFCLHQPLPPMF
jgi:hypothetical protein